MKFGSSVLLLAQSILELQLQLSPVNGGRNVRLRGESVALTRTEFRLLEVFAKSLGRAFTREELLSRAFDPDFDGVDRTVDVHITNLRKKIERRGEHRGAELYREPDRSRL